MIDRWSRSLSLPDGDSNLIFFSCCIPNNKTCQRKFTWNFGCHFLLLLVLHEAPFREALDCNEFFDRRNSLCRYVSVGEINMISIRRRLYWSMFGIGVLLRGQVSLLQLFVRIWLFNFCARGIRINIYFFFVFSNIYLLDLGSTMFVCIWGSGRNLSLLILWKLRSTDDGRENPNILVKWKLLALSYWCS